MKKLTAALGCFLLTAVAFSMLLAHQQARAQDVPVPCYPCEPDPPATCSLCHTW